MRKTKTFDEDEIIDLEELTGILKKKKSDKNDIEIVRAVAEQSSFSSRGDRNKKARKRSPFVIQKNIKMRIGMSELLTEITEKLQSDSDQDTLEKAIFALIEKEEYAELIKQYNVLIAS